MTAEFYAIKALKKGVWFYLSRSGEWIDDLYWAKEFGSRKEAETFLYQNINEHYWGGFFSINKYYVSR